MRIGIGAILGTVGGPATYARELIHAVARADAATEYFVIADRPDLLGDCPANLFCVEVPLAGPFSLPLWDHLLVPRAIRKLGLDLYHGTKTVLPLRRGNCREVITVHDLAVYHQPETFAWAQRLHQRTHMPPAIRRADRIIAVSESARRDVLARFRVSPERVTVIPHGVAARFRPEPGANDERIASALNLPPRYLLYAGTIQPRKHVDLLVDAYAQLGVGDVALLIAGRVRPGYQPRFLRQPVAGVRYLGPVSDPELAVLYRRALALISPSGYEGFGLSLLEAMASGCLVVAADNSAVPELVADCGILLPGLDVGHLRDAIAQVLGAPPALDELRGRALARARQYSWEETARRTLAVYRDALRPE